MPNQEEYKENNPEAAIEGSEMPEGESGDPKNPEELAGYASAQIEEARNISAEFEKSTAEMPSAFRDALEGMSEEDKKMILAEGGVGKIEGNLEQAKINELNERAKQALKTYEEEMAALAPGEKRVPQPEGPDLVEKEKLPEISPEYMEAFKKIREVAMNDKNEQAFMVFEKDGKIVTEKVMKSSDETGGSIDWLKMIEISKK